MVHDRDLSLTPGASPLVNSTPRTFQDSADRFARLRGASIRTGFDVTERVAGDASALR